MKQTGKNLNTFLIINFIALAICGLIAIYSASQMESAGGAFSTPFVKQIIWVILGLIIIFILSNIDYEIFLNMSWIFYIIVLLALVFVLFKGDESRRWFRVWIIKVQPSEFMKIPLILVLASYLSNKQLGEFQSTLTREIKVLAVTGIITIIPMFLIMIEPDLGSSLIFPVLLMAILFVAGLNLNIFLIIIFFAVALLVSIIFQVIWIENITDISPFLYQVLLIINEHLGLTLTLLSVLGITILISIIIRFLGFKVNYIMIFLVWLVFSIGFFVGTKAADSIKPYQRDRIMTFIKPEVDSKGSGWNVLQSKIAIGSGMVHGKGFLKGTQHRFRFLPERHTDFIYSVIGEEFGFIGGLFIILLYLAMIIQIFMVSFYASSSFGKFTAAGIMFLFLFHIVENIGMAIGILPVTGLPLPLISYGGSSFITFSIGIGLLLNISKQGSFTQQ